jgi:tetratricopeptide (TPR) repeat protein
VLFLKRPLLTLAAGALFLGGCSLFESRTVHAYNQYQAALAAGDLNRAHVALIKLVAADEDEPDYWVELGKLELRLGDYAGAYQALSRAHELDRNNVEVLATLTQFALASRQIEVADEQARMLALLSPDNPVVSLVRGYVALKAGNLDKADAEAQGLIARNPNDSSAKLLEARVLIARYRIDDAIALLEEQFQSTPDDLGAARELVSLYRSKEDWRALARVHYALYKLVPGRNDVSVELVESLMRSGQIEAAGAIARPMLSGAANPRLVEQLLDDWANYAPSGTVLPDAGRLAQASNGDARVSFASYFNRIGKPKAARALLGNPHTPVTPANARWNAVYAQALDAMRQSAQALNLYDQVLQAEPDQVDALKGRSLLFARMGRGRQAIADAQRLVSAEPNSGRDRLILAEVFTAAGKPNEARRTLWDAFQDLPNDDRVFAALKRLLLSKGDLDGARRLDDERVDHRYQTLSQESV